jgi:V/A-type H+-transporting ATPase subunit A
MEGRIIKVSGPLIVAEGMADAKMFDVVHVSKYRLIGEIIELRGDRASVQVYEETSGIGPGDVVFETGSPLSVELGPGLIESIFDGIQRPLDKIYEKTGPRIRRGVEALALSRDKKWSFVPSAAVGESLAGGDVLGSVKETALVDHKIMVPPDMGGTTRATWRRYPCCKNGRSAADGLISARCLPPSPC